MADSPALAASTGAGYDHVPFQVCRISTSGLSSTRVRVDCRSGNHTVRLVSMHREIISASSTSLRNSTRADLGGSSPSPKSTRYGESEFGKFQSRTWRCRDRLPRQDEHPSAHSPAHTRGLEQEAAHSLTTVLEQYERGTARPVRASERKVGSHGCCAGRSAHALLLQLSSAQCSRIPVPSHHHRPGSGRTETPSCRGGRRPGQTLDVPLLAFAIPEAASGGQEPGLAHGMERHSRSGDGSSARGGPSLIRCVLGDSVLWEHFAY